MQQSQQTYDDETLRKAIADCTNTFMPQEKQVDLGDKKPWFVTNVNGTRTFLHRILAQELLKKFSIVRYPTPHSDLYYFNSKKGIYEQDKSGRQIKGIIRSMDDLKQNHVREVYSYLEDTSPIVNEISSKYVAVENGLINLNTFELEPFSPAAFLIQKVPTAYNENAHDSFIDSTLTKVTKGHVPSIQNIKEMFACVLYPQMLVPKMFYLYGRSAHNGKSSLLNMIHETFNKNGGNISAVSPQKLATNTFAAASMYGKFANIVDDLPDLTIEDSGTLKSIITWGNIEIERKGKDSETVKMYTPLITASNHFPNFKENGAQINRRLFIIPFEHNFSTDTDCISDIESMRRIASVQAREYVLKLAVETLADMLKNPDEDILTPNEKARRAGESFAEQSDPLLDYFCEFDVNYFEESQGTGVLEDYDAWCSKNRVQGLTTKRFKEVVCSHYNMEWKQKRVNINGVSKSVKGFAKK